MQKNRKILIVLVIIVWVFVGFLVVNKNREEKNIENLANPYLNSNIQVKTFKGEKGWGYEIFIEDVKYVSQPNIPALPGDAGFKNEKDAKAVAELMVQKIRDNIIPPRVTEEEVKALISE